MFAQYWRWHPSALETLVPVRSINLLFYIITLHSSYNPADLKMATLVVLTFSVAATVRGASPTYCVITESQRVLTVQSVELDTACLQLSIESIVLTARRQQLYILRLSNLCTSFNIGRFVSDQLWRSSSVTDWVMATHLLYSPSAPFTLYWPVKIRLARPVNGQTDDDGSTAAPGRHNGGDWQWRLAAI